MELGFVPWHATVASRRLRRLIALIDLDLEEGSVRDGKGRVRMLFGVCPVVEDGTTRRLRLAAAGRAAFTGLRPAVRVTYRFAVRSRLVLSMQPEECPEVRSEPDETADVHVTVDQGDSFDFGRISERRPTWRPHSANRSWRFRQDLTDDSQIASVQASRLQL